jgi:putative ABC transport system ATP-binding protein
MIRVENVWKLYLAGSAVIEILRDVSFEIGRGEIVGLWGPSGAGKTTLLNLIGGVDTPSSGEIVVDGRQLSRMSRRELALYRLETIGFVFQNYHLLPNLSVIENVSVPLLLKGISVRAATRRAADCLECVGLERRAGHLPEQLSGGERQRAAIARALSADPSLLLADEPTGSLDSVAGNMILELLDQLHRSFRTTMLIVTHDDCIAARCHRILSLNDGKASWRA